MITKLPIDSIKVEFISSLAKTNTLLLSAQPGAGKSTRVPLWLLTQNFKGKIYLVQPRRLAAKSIAYYLAKECGEEVGQRVGYRLKDEVCVSKNTLLEVITEGILIQIIQHDPELLTTAMVVMDEFHERSLQMDIAFALLRDVQSGLNDELKLLLMSATLASNQLMTHLPDAAYLSCEGRSYPITVDYQPVKNIKLWRQHALGCIENAVKNFQGSILVFLPGSSDIRYIYNQLQTRLSADVELCPLYGSLSLAAQKKAIRPSAQGLRKIVLATNIAETSLTIEGITLVIDTGLEKVACFDDNTLTNHLQLRTIAKASAIQRAGRAGRLSKGHCIRLYSEEDFSRRPQEAPLAIKQADILVLLIEAARWGVKSLNQLPLLDFPSEHAADKGWQHLVNLKIVDREHRLTEHGDKVSQLSCHPRYGHMILIASQLEQQHNCFGLAQLACLLAALLEQHDTLSSSQPLQSGNIVNRVEYFIQEQARKDVNTPQLKRLQAQVNRLIKAAKVNKANELPLKFCGELLAIAYPERIAKKREQDGEFLAAYGKGLIVEPHDSLAQAPFIVAAEIVKNNRGLSVKTAAQADINTLLTWKVVTHNKQIYVHYSNKKQAIEALAQKRIGAIVLEEKKLNERLSSAEIIAVWQQQLIKNGIEWLNWQVKDLQLLMRWRWLNRCNKQLNLPDVSVKGLLDQLSLWFLPFLDGVLSKTQLDKLNLSEQLLTLLDYQQQQILNKLAPTHFISATGRRCVIRYSIDKNPTVSLPMQDLYGMNEGPRIGGTNANTSVALVLEMLSPAQRPIQVTQDLSGFWQSSYKEVQKDMKANYPKHYWPDDPANAVATTKTKKHILK
ncbi:ATP-dependent helicase HrpB [Thalassotalea piscium]|uniref:ATP-dependent helicase HrpB n=1 Tax=Thalassotalea piscium TaxID=1230533 RepID=A0A7X0NJJ4_9GAMM|nr:ATP-dependent helicase HrpB [Thalassotalea piscium]MBB6544642.1 ATP-dependent helicase HrpB [Thalassotalea piscium]